MPFSLHDAVKRGDLSKVQHILNTAENIIDTQNQEGKTALLVAVEEGHNAIARFLIHQGADSNIEDCFHNFPLRWAVIDHNDELVALLEPLKSHAPTLKHYGKDALIAAIQKSYNAIAQSILEDKSTVVDIDNRSDGDLLSMANGIKHIFTKHYGNQRINDKIQSIVSDLIVLNRVDYYIENHPYLIRMSDMPQINDYNVNPAPILQSKSVLDICDNRGCNLLIIAMYAGNSDITRFLLKKGMQTGGMSFSLIYAIRKKHHSMIKLFLENRAYPSIYTQSDETALEYAIFKSNDIAIIDWLLQKEVELNQYKKNSWSLLETIFQRSFRHVLTLTYDDDRMLTKEQQLIQIQANLEHVTVSLLTKFNLSFSQLALMHNIRSIQNDFEALLKLSKNMQSLLSSKDSWPPSLTRAYECYTAQSEKYKEAFANCYWSLIRDNIEKSAIFINFLQEMLNTVLAQRKSFTFFSPTDKNRDYLCRVSNKTQALYQILLIGKQKTALEEKTSIYSTLPPEIKSMIAEYFLFNAFSEFQVAYQEELHQCIVTLRNEITSMHSNISITPTP